MAKQVIFALFADEAAAQAAAASLEAWDKDEKSITLDTVAVLTVDERASQQSVPGRVATAAKGAGAGVVITVLFGTLIGGPLFLLVAGGVLGAIKGRVGTQDGGPRADRRRARRRQGGRGRPGGRPQGR